MSSQSSRSRVTTTSTRTSKKKINIRDSKVLGFPQFCGISASAASGISHALCPELHRVSTCPPQHHREASPVASHSFSQTGSRIDVCSTQAEWYCSLVELLVEDLLEYAKEFPLQIRWIYSELQVSASFGILFIICKKCPELKSTNAVWCNLLFLRGICPSICKGPDGSGAESPARDTKTLTTVAKNLIALTSQKRSDNALPSEIFESCRSKLLNKFAPHVMSPLSTEELNRLEGLYIEEAMRASANSMSRELAQLASYFQLVFLPDSSGAGGGGGGECTGLNNARTLLNKAQLAVKHKPNVPNLRESLLELSQFTPTTSISLHHHLHGEGALVPVSASAPASGTSTVVGTALMPTSTTAAVAITTTTTTSVTTVSATHSRSSGGLIRGLGGIFASSTSLPKGSVSNPPSNTSPFT